MPPPRGVIATRRTRRRRAQGRGHRSQGPLGNIFPRRRPHQTRLRRSHIFAIAGGMMVVPGHDGCSRGCRNQAPSRAHGFIRAYPPWTKRPTDWALALTRGEPSRRSVNGSETGRGCWSGKPLRRGISFGHSWSGRLTFTPVPDEHRYELTGEGTFERLLGVGVDNRSTAVVTPAGFEPAISTLKGSRPWPS